MAALNIVGVASMYGKVVGSSVGTVLGDVVLNPAASGKVFKVNTLVASNPTTTESTITVQLRKADGLQYSLVTGAVVPEATSLVVISKDLMTYLEEGDAIEALCTNSVDIVCSYEEIA